MSNSLPLFISIAALVLSAASPIVSAIVQIKERKLEIKADLERRQQEYYDKHRAEAIEKYIGAVGEFCKTESIKSLEPLGASMGEIYFYVDQSLWPILDAISEKVRRHGFEPPDNELIHLCKALSDDKVRAKK